MKAIVSTEQKNAPESNVLQERISLLGDNNFLWREIAALTSLPKKLIKGIATGKYVPDQQETDRLLKIFDEVIEKLKVGAEKNDTTCPEQYLDAEAYEFIKLDVKDVVLYKGTGDDKMIVQIRGVKFYD